MSKLSKKDEKELELARNRVLAVVNKNPIKAVEESKKYLSFAKEKKSKRDCGFAYLYTGHGLLNLRKFDLAVRNFNKAIIHFEEIQDVDNKANTLLALGMVERNTGNLAQALKYYYKAIEQPVSDAISANAYNNIAVVYEKQHDLERALGYFNKGLKIIKKLHPPNLHNIGFTMVNIANVYRQVKEYDMAIKMFEKALKIADENENNILKVRSMRGLGACYASIQKHKESMKLLRSAFSISKEIGFHAELINISLEMILSLKAIGEYEERKEILLYSVNIAKRYQKAYVSPCLLALIDHYSDVEDYENAYKTQVEYSKLKEEEEKKQREEKLHELQVKFETAEKEREIAFLKKQKEVELREKTMELELQALRAQLNPHFIFNALNAIQSFVLRNDTLEASTYLSNFALLMRKTLNASRKPWVLLMDEVEILEHYLKLESLRVRGQFHYTIEVEEEIERDKSYVPSMLLQPFVENAIEHGVRHQKGGYIRIVFRKCRKHGMYIHVIDNGSGFNTKEVLSKEGETEGVHALHILQERLTLLSETTTMVFRHRIRSKEGVGTHITFYSETTNLMNGIHGTKGREIQ